MAACAPPGAAVAPTPQPSLEGARTKQDATLAHTCALTITNGTPIPVCTSADFFPPTSAGGLDRHIITSGETVDPNSAAMIADNFGTTGGSSDDTIGLMWHNGVAQSSYSYGRPLYRATTNDPQVTVSCLTYCGPFGYSETIYIPAHALSEGGSDHHISIIQPDYTLYEFWAWQTSPPYTNGGTASAGSFAVTEFDGTKYSSNDIQPGWMSNAMTAGGMVGPMGVITLAELQAKNIQHELYGVVSCTASTWYYPATQTARVCTDGRTAIPDGALLRYKPTCATINANGALSQDEKTVDCAMHIYGVRISDDGICVCSEGGLSVQVENQAAFWSYGTGSDPYIAYAIANGWNHVNGGGIDRYTHEFVNSDYPTNMEVLASGQ